MKNTFPTIKQMADVLAYVWDSPKVTYNQSTNKFIITEAVPFPVFDEGGAMDSVDFEFEDTEVSFHKAYMEYVDFMNRPDEDELPF